MKKKNKPDFYTNRILPWLIERAMSRPEMANKRREVLATAKGKVLEIGFGSGLNLLVYPAAVQEIMAVDNNPGLNRYAKKRIAQNQTKVRHLVISAEQLPFPDNTFDTVVSTWTLCSIADVSQALKEIHRVLRPDGQFLFIEHGLSTKPKIQKWQRRLTPVWKRVAGGCHLDRDMKQLLINHGFQIIDFASYVMPQTAPFIQEMYHGQARKI